MSASLLETPQALAHRQGQQHHTHRGAQAERLEEKAEDIEELAEELERIAEEMKETIPELRELGWFYR